MKKSLLIILTYLISFSIIAENLCTVSLRIEGTKNTQGYIQVGVYKSDTDFQRENFIFKRRIPAKNEFEIAIENIPEGEYGIAVYHDENGNNRMDKNFIGIPVEG